MKQAFTFFLFIFVFSLLVQPAFLKAVSFKYDYDTMHSGASYQWTDGAIWNPSAPVDGDDVTIEACPACNNVGPAPITLSIFYFRCDSTLVMVIPDSVRIVVLLVVLV